MTVSGADLLANLVSQGRFSAKMVFNQNGALIFPAAEEHRHHKIAGISYEDNYEGNALAALLSPGKIDVRFHAKFTASQVSAIVLALLIEPELSLMRGWTPRYQGRTISSES
jgi:hypothetical protein